MAGGVASDWVAKYGRGIIQQEQKEELRASLLHGFKDLLPSQAGLRIAAQEIDAFLLAGRITDSNLERLQRNVLSRLGGSQTARCESAYSTTAGFTKDQPLTSRQHKVGQEADILRRTGTSLAGTSRSALAPTGPEEDMYRWSQVAKIVSIQEVDEKEHQKVAHKSAQKEMAEFLKQQMEEKKKQQEKDKASAQQLFELQEAELLRWNMDQSANNEAKIRKAFEVKQAREKQIADFHQRKNDEKMNKMDEDQRLVQRVNLELAFESRISKEKKDRIKKEHIATLDEGLQGKESLKERRAKRIQEEQKIAEDYAALLAQQEVRNRVVIPAARGENVSLPRSKRRGEEVYSDEKILSKIHKETLQRQMEEELRKLDQKKQQSLSNQEFLFKQMAEREQQKKQAIDQKSDMKIAAQAASAEFLDDEKRRIATQRAKLSQYKSDLEEQIKIKKERKRVGEDEMSQAERAINRQFLNGAAGLLKQDHSSDR